MMSMPGLGVFAQATGRSRKSFLTGLVACVLIAFISTGIAAVTRVPAILIALLSGIVLARPMSGKVAPAGIKFGAQTVLRLGVALIGARVSVRQIASIGLPSFGLVIGGVLMSLIVGSIVGRLLGLSWPRAILSGGSVGICGASAALAISTALPPSAERERETLFTIAAVTMLGTVAMLTYPWLARVAGFGDIQTGVFLGASIHDVTQVVSAGAMVSPDALIAATATKMARVACLAPATLLIGLAARQQGSGEIRRPPLVPGFLWLFIALALIANTGLVPHPIVQAMSWAATFCLVTATAALGLRTSLRELIGSGWRPLLVLIVQTAMLATFAASGLMLLA